MRWVLPIAGIVSLAGLGAIYLAARRQGRPVLFVQQGVAEDGEFRTVARVLGGMMGVTAIPVRTPQELIRALQQVGRVNRLVIHGHGSSAGVMVAADGRGIRVNGRDTSPQMGVVTFARYLAPYLVPGFVIGLNACSSGSSPGESGWGAHSYTSAGERSFAASLRDALVAAGAPTGAVRANSAIGTHGNPSGRTFVVDRAHVGRPGTSLMEQTWGAGADTREWAQAAQGARAYRWIIGGDPGLNRRTA